MAFVRWFGENDYFRRMSQLQRQMSRQLNSGFGHARPTPSVYPAINIYDDGESFIARAEISGVDPKTIDITVTGDTLTVRGNREISRPEEGSAYHRRERSGGEFRRAFNLPEQVDSSKVVAKSTNGVLEIVLPRAEQARQRKVQVNA